MDWPSINHSQFNAVAECVRTYPRVVLAGRRRIGKSYMISQIAQQLWKGKESVFYIALPQIISEDITSVFLREVLEALYTFDDSIPKPTPGMFYRNFHVFYLN